MPDLMRAYPTATGVVEQAARDGERGQRVHTWLGRTSPRPGGGWRAGQQRASLPDATAADERLARRQARDWGRFTRNFVVQGSAAEWALCWLAAVRRDLAAVAASTTPEQRPDLVYFLHDEIMVHTPAELADPVAEIVRAGATEAGRLMFGEVGVEFAIELSIVRATPRRRRCSPIGRSRRSDPAAGGAPSARPKRAGTMARPGVCRCASRAGEVCFRVGFTHWGDPFRVTTVG